ncbi:MAG: nucleotide exchange factor GrpE [Clostridiaceae bacterium]|nr:nucleotide exchange factor GrpE [Clostridiaceae bacterium]
MYEDKNPEMNGTNFNGEGSETIKDEVEVSSQENGSEVQDAAEGKGDNTAGEVNETDLKDVIAKKEQENKELLDRIQRLAAEFDNFRKRTQKEKERLYDEAVCDVIVNILPVVDNLERALKAAESVENSGLKEGVTLVYRQIIDIFEKLKIKSIDAVGKPFDPQLHNAVMHVEDENLGNNIVAEEFQKGYIYKDEIVIRHSMVKVAN